MPESNISQIRTQIEQEIQSMHTGFHGFAAGVARHQFLDARSRRLDRLEQQLAAQVGEEQALLFTCQTYMQQTKEQA